MTNEDILDLLSLMPRAVDLVWRRDSGPIQCDEAGETLPLDDMEAARAFLRDHGKEVACYRLDPREEGKLIVGMFNDGEAKTIARERAEHRGDGRFIRSKDALSRPPRSRWCF